MDIDDIYNYIAFRGNPKLSIIKSCDPNEIVNEYSLFQKYLQRDSPSVDIVKLLINLGGNVNGLENEYSTPLCTILSNIKKYKHMLDVVKILIENNADVNKKNSDGETPLYCLLSNGYIKNNKEILLYMIQMGAETTLLSKDGYTMLQVYVKTNHHIIDIEIIKILLESGIDINTISNKEKYDTLDCYFKYNIDRIDANILKLFVDNGFIIKKEDKSHKKKLMEYLNSLLYDNRRVKKNILDFIFTYINVNQVDELGFNPLYYSVSHNNRTIFEYIIQLGGNINCISELGDTLLFKAFENRSLFIFNSILEKKPNKKTISYTYYKLRKHLLDVGDFINQIEFDIIKKFIAHVILYVKNFSVRNRTKAFIYFDDFIEKCTKSSNYIHNTYINNETIFQLCFNKKYIPISVISNNEKLLKKHTKLFYYGNILKKNIEKSKKYYENIYKVSCCISNLCDTCSYWNTIPLEIKFKIVNNLSLNDIEMFLKNNKK
ncbi:ankyrin-like protein [Lumpy skin disease virus]|uniref:Ankyrin-like protein n=1 Tax=Lumpy skin disease virus TaxID=59509 RepID=A0A1B3B6C6_LSDV|nr:ankyrin-like protein [Lumpy skin disease virus NI-2490]AOE47727.1 ankyrin-like protein [Lumpy skin disease virus]AAK85113.1 LSDV152 ankyrin repeat protein [Lumpy skin disease virus NI-2490]QEJ78699.1 hypothetical protein LSD-Kenya_152 [Lumpy skin disease virus]QTO66077.1 ankyrin-like protein [Lumpy skin disease virus]UJQ44072.1 Ankyrin repeat domain-containing protein M-T5 [Lumpy skin disease virus]